MTPSETTAAVKAERAWAIKFLGAALGIIGTLLVWMWLNLGATLSEIKGEVKELRCEVQDTRYTSAAARAGLENRITRLETRLDLDP